MDDGTSYDHSLSRDANSLNKLFVIYTTKNDVLNCVNGFERNG